MDWTDFLTAVAVLFVIEGLLPFISPSFTREMMASIRKKSDLALRITGFLSMLAGLVLLYLVR